MGESANGTAPGAGASAGAVSLVAVGRIVRTQGRRGEVRVEPLTDAPERLAELRECWLVPPAAGERHDVEAVWFQGRVPVVKLAGSATHDGRPGARRPARHDPARGGAAAAAGPASTRWSSWGASWRPRTGASSARSRRSSRAPSTTTGWCSDGDRAWSPPRGGGDRASGWTSRRGAWWRGRPRGSWSWTRDADRRRHAVPGDAPGGRSTSRCSAWPGSGAPSTSGSSISETTRRAGTGSRTTTRSAAAAAWC